MDKNKEFLLVFTSEAKDILNDVSSTLIELEKDAENVLLINKLFRFLHTLKGSSSLDGFEKITVLSNNMESIFASARDKEIVLNPKDIDVLFEAVDKINELLNALLNEEYDKITNEKLIEKLIKILPKKTNLIHKIVKGQLHLNEENIREIKENINKDSSIYFIEMYFSEKETGAINTLIILNNLSANSIILLSSPSDEELSNIKFLSRTQILIVSNQTINSVNDIVSLNCSDFKVKKKNINQLKSFMIDEQNVKDKLFLSTNEFLEIDKYISEEKAKLITLSYEKNDKIKAVNAYVIYNNLKKKSDYIKSFPDIEKIRQGLDFDNLTFIYCGEYNHEELKKVIKTNCKKFETIILNKNNIEKYVISENRIPQKADLAKKDLTEEIVQLKKEKRKEISASIHVEVDKFIVDGVIENVGEMVVNVNFMSMLVNDIMEMEDLSFEQMKEQLEILSNRVQSTNLICNMLMDYAVMLKLVPLKPLFKKFPRIIRDASKKVGKKVAIEIKGERVRVDQNIMNILEGPIIHILRNSVDHGIGTPGERKKVGKPETGKIIIQAEQKHNSVIIKITDDGKGIDKEQVLKKAIQKGLITESEIVDISLEDIYGLLFHPGFSTKDELSELSGRGVGMDVVKSELEKVNGNISIESELGKGSSFILKFPIMI